MLPAEKIGEEFPCVFCLRAVLARPDVMRVAYLIEKGHRVLNVDRVPLDLPGVENRLADVTDAGQMFDVMARYAGI